MKRNRYTQEFKQQIVQEVAEVGNAAQVARRHELNPKMVYQWVKQSKHRDLQATPAEGKKVAPYTPTVEELRVIEAENNTLKRLLGEKDLEIEILRELVKKPANILSSSR